MACVKCPHCLVDFHEQPYFVYLGKDAAGHWAIKSHHCPSCNKLNFELQSAKSTYAELTGDSDVRVGAFGGLGGVIQGTLIRPRGSKRPPCPPEVPTQFECDYTEACVVLPDSAKAAAALGRRCLQNLLRDFVKVKPGNLADEIQQVLDSNALPSDLAESIDVIRNAGNFAAHPLKSKQSGLILEVEYGEAEWTLDVLEALFDFYFVRPAQRKKKRDEMDKKLQEAGKPPLK